MYWSWLRCWFTTRHNGNRGIDNAALLAGVSYSDFGLEESGMGIAFGNYDNDGWLDLSVSNFQRETNTIYRNQTEGLFADVTIQTGVSLASYTYLGWGVAFFDMTKMDIKTSLSLTAT